MYKNLILPFILAVFLVSCENPFDYQFETTDPLPVIEAWITNEYKNQEIIVSYTLSSPNDSVRYARDARVYVTDGQNVYDFVEQEGNPGHYVSTEKFLATVDRTYDLTVELDGKTYTASTNVLPVFMPDSMRFLYVQEKGLYRIDYVAPYFSPYESALYIIYLDWSNVAGYQDLPYDSTHAKVYFFTLKTVDVNQLFPPYHEDVYFPVGTKVTEYKYSLTPFFEQYVRAMLVETSWSGSLFDVQHFNLPTNIQGGALGYFTASSVVEREYVVR